MTDIGHNGVAADELRQFVERIEQLETEKAGIASDIRDVKTEAKGRGYCVATLTHIISLRKLSIESRSERDAIIEIYREAVGL